MPLPGPTGETNILSLHPRGVILCIGSFSDVKRQMYKALLMDNSVIVHAASGHETIESPSQTLIKESALENLISLIDRAAVRDLINGPIDGVAADGQYRTALSSQSFSAAVKVQYCQSLAPIPSCIGFVMSAQ